MAACIGLACLAIGIVFTARRWQQEDFQCFTFACWELLRLSAFWVVAYIYHDDQVSSASGYLFTTKPPHDSNRILPSNRGGSVL